MNIPALIEKMLVLFFAIAAGFVCGKTKVLDDSANRAISKLVVKLTSPMLTLSSVMGKAHLLSNREVLMLTGIAFLLYGTNILLSCPVVRLLHGAPEDTGLMRFLFIFCNMSYVGYPIVQALFGADASFYVTVFILCSQLFSWSYGVHLVSGHGKFYLHWSILKNPCILASLTAYTIYLTGFEVPAVIAASCSFVGQCTSPLIMFITGCALSLMPLKQVFTNWRLYALFGCKMILVPLLAFALLHNLISNQLILGIVIVALCMPTATNATNISYLYGGNHALASSGVMISTLLSMVTIPLMMQLLFG